MRFLNYPDRYREFKLKNTKEVYILDKLIIQIALLSFLLLIVFTLYLNNWDLDFYSCPYDLCKNPFYKPISWKNLEYVPKGDYGNGSPNLITIFFSLAIGLMIIAFMLNHFIYNKGKWRFIQLEADNNKGIEQQRPISNKGTHKRH